MLDQLHQAAKTGWIGSAEAVATDLSFDYFIMYSLAMLSASIFVCWCLIIQLQLYQMCPGWGPIRKFDNDGTEEMRINQLLIHEDNRGVGHNLKGDKSTGDENLNFLQGMLGQAHGEMAGLMAGKVPGGGAPDGAPGAMEEGQQRGGDNGLYSGFQQTYGSLGPCTWGYCESPNQWGQPKMDPRYGEVVVRHGFADSQWMRAQSRTWARDEPYYQNVQGLRAAPPSLAEDTCITNRMVIERGGY